MSGGCKRVGHLETVCWKVKRHLEPRWFTEKVDKGGVVSQPLPQSKVRAPDRTASNRTAAEAKVSNRRTCSARAWDKRHPLMTLSGRGSSSVTSLSLPRTCVALHTQKHQQLTHPQPGILRRLPLRSPWHQRPAPSPREHSYQVPGSGTRHQGLPHPHTSLSQFMATPL